MIIEDSDKSDELFEFYETGQTTRYHNKPGIPKQTVAEHSFAMLLLLTKLHPDPSARLMQAIIRHDLPESDGFFFDAPHDAKEEWPALREIEKSAEQSFNEHFELQPVQLTEVEKLWLKYLDGLEVLFYLVHVLPQSTNRAQEIYERQWNNTAELEKKLQAHGYLIEPKSTVH